MENIEVTLDDETFDEILAESRLRNTPEIGGTLRLAVKRKATEKGDAGVVIAFHVMHDGEEIPVQAVTTAALLASALRGIARAVGND